MYEELIKRLQDFAAGTERDKDAQLAFEAVDAIEKLQEDSVPIDDMEMILSEVAKPRWISVTERLPEKYDCYYLVVLNNWNTDFCLYTKEKGFGMYITPKWWDANDEVTHWMPLPEPPKEKAIS